jgi:hypothetical protein
MLKSFSTESRAHISTLSLSKYFLVDLNISENMSAWMNIFELGDDEDN